MAEIIARWESRGGKYWVEMDLFIPSEGDYAGVEMYGYVGDHGGGGLAARNRDDAFVEMQAKIDRGQFLPDKAKTPMRRVF